MSLPRNSKEKIIALLKERKKTLKRLKHIDEIFREEKTNEDAWPGHDTIGYCHANIEGQVWESHLKLIERQLRELGWKDEKK
ncbi:MAG: hypothetical protein ABH867_04055 [Patescibacteria group bacterium]|nr:hypothetical protein [Patescibacteria group bacterium]